MVKEINIAAFIRHTNCEECGSSDAKAVYDDGSTYCWSCTHATLSEEYKELLNEKKPKKKRKDISNAPQRKEVMQDETPVKPSKPVIDPEVAQEIKKDATTECNEFRGLSDETTKYFLVRHKFDEDGEVNEQFYPCTQDGQLTGYKIRSVPKDFRSIGRTGADCQLFGQFRFNRGGKYVLIVEGELDQLSAYQMLSEYNKSRGSDFEIAVVSPTTGAQSKKQIAAQYKFLDMFENIILCMDNDKAGKEATEQLIKCLPKGKVKVMNMRLKDPNAYLEQDKGKDFVQDFYNSKKQVPVGVLPSDQLMDRILGQAAIAKVPFPDFMGKLNDMFISGMPLGHIINIAADTGLGKTTLVNEMIYYWIFNSPHKVGVVSMELDAGQYGEALLSRHLSKKLSLIPTQEEKLEYLKSDRIMKLSNELMTDENGDARFYLLDNRDGTVEEIQDTIEELVVACGAKVIVLDVLQDVLDGLSNEDQSLFMKWAKGFMKSHGITFVFINHMRKTPVGQSGADNESNVMGSSTIIKSASANILLKRDKMAEDPVVRNSTEILVTKNRVCGLTGPAGSVYYDNDTHTLHELDAWLNENAPK